MTRRTYDQTCSLAGALDLVGERWTLLLVRELLTGPKRYKDLQAGLAGIGTNLLATRLDHLGAAGLVRQVRLPAPAGVDAYELTAAGGELEPVVLALVRWGLRHQAVRSDAFYRPEWTAVAMRALFVPERAAGLRLSCELRVEGSVLYAEVDDGTLKSGVGTARDPDVTVCADQAAFRRIEAGEPTAAVAAAGGLRLEGDPEAFERFRLLFDLPEPVPPTVRSPTPDSKETPS